MGVDFGQGFYLARPEPLEGFLAKLSDSGAAGARTPVTSRVALAAERGAINSKPAR